LPKLGSLFSSIMRGTPSQRAMSSTVYFRESSICASSGVMSFGLNFDPCSRTFGRCHSPTFVANETRHPFAASGFEQCRVLDHAAVQRAAREDVRGVALRRERGAEAAAGVFEDALSRHAVVGPRADGRFRPA
jgi:hypothetical protein